MTTNKRMSWADVETDEDLSRLIAHKSKPDARGRYHCICCGKFADPPDPARNNGEPRCEDHDFSWPGGFNRAEYDELYRWANQW